MLDWDSFVANNVGHFLDILLGLEGANVVGTDAHARVIALRLVLAFTTLVAHGRGVAA